MSSETFLEKMVAGEVPSIAISLKVAYPCLKIVATGSAVWPAAIIAVVGIAGVAGVILYQKKMKTHNKME